MQALTAGAVLVLAACAVLAAAGVCCLAKWDGRRYAMLARPRAAQLAAAPIPQTASAAARGPSSPACGSARPATGRGQPPTCSAACADAPGQQPTTAAKSSR
jgi:hypothetical protein